MAKIIKLSKSECEVCLAAYDKNYSLPTIKSWGKMGLLYVRHSKAVQKLLEKGLLTFDECHIRTLTPKGLALCPIWENLMTLKVKGMLPKNIRIIAPTQGSVLEQ